MARGTDPYGKQRVATLQGYDLLDTPAEEEFNTIVHQAAAAVGTPMAIVSLLDENRQWFKARVGIDLAETSITASFCAHAIRGPGVVAVADATLDARFARNPLVTGKPHIRFYAGATLQLDGVRVGTLCVLDTQPRSSLSHLEERYLTYLADRTVKAMKTRRRQ